jgi:sugar/nucleoside kinase (ribokinase family)
VVAPPLPSPDIVGFGALNVDYIAGASKLSAGRLDSVRESTARFEWGAESAAEEGAVRAVVEQLGHGALEASLGGSAWLTIFSLARMRVDLRLGYVGYLGRIQHPGLSFLRQMRALHIDHRFVGRDPARSCGVCVSYIEDGERVTLTRPGANAALADYLEGAEPLVGRLSRPRARLVTRRVACGGVDAANHGLPPRQLPGVQGARPVPPG